ncbi:hypothetical protein L228DRAFT_88038 [Xylona heveae TC161]|uniref:Uncharacterized protein n=1 Tax=Xylona heveae (strain CBS 132557 / TC161) TaxID=1328760 RepID=A0A165HXN7_XYLHT|nr:hypothetical protein L228DRAFT_88038 [Xylona heveae TC161]KZF24070.1 hypothetical protein L228DRAFT_88038 [Xylona heveae TC161]
MDVSCLSSYLLLTCNMFLVQYSSCNSPFRSKKICVKTPSLIPPLVYQGIASLYIPLLRARTHPQSLHQRLIIPSQVYPMKPNSRFVFPHA